MQDAPHSLPMENQFGVPISRAGLQDDHGGGGESLAQKPCAEEEHGQPRAQP